MVKFKFGLWSSSWNFIIVVRVMVWAINLYNNGCKVIGLVVVAIMVLEVNYVQMVVRGTYICNSIYSCFRNKNLNLLPHFLLLKSCIS